VLTSDKAVRGNGPLSLVWIVEPSSVQQFQTSDGATLVITTGTSDSTLSIMQIVGLGDKVAWQRVLIKCGKGSGPPPGPNPPPDPPPPDPVPVARNLFLAVVEDTLNRTEPTIKVMNAVGIWNSFRETGDDWRPFDVTTKETKGKKAVLDAIKASLPPPDNTALNDATIAKLKSSGKLPLLLVYDLDADKLLSVEKLPATVKDLTDTRNKYKETK